MSSELLDDDVREEDEVVTETALEAQLAVLEEENKRLREEYAATKRTQYQRTALTLVGVGLLAAVAGVLFPNARTVLLALGGTGVFVGILTYYLTPEEFLPASLGQNVYEALATNESAIVGELGLSDEVVYVPVENGPDAVKLFVPQHEDYTIPSEDALTDVFVVSDDETERGIALQPTGEALVDEFTRALSGELGDESGTVASQLSDALVEQFELVESAEPDVDSEAGRITVAVSGSSYGSVDRFDHPVASLLAVGVAQAMGKPLTLAVDESDDDRVDARVTCYLRDVGRES